MQKIKEFVTMLEGGYHNLYIETLYRRLSKWRVTVLEGIVVSYFGVVLVLNSSLSKFLHVKNSILPSQKILR